MGPSGAGGDEGCVLPVPHTLAPCFSLAPFLGLAPAPLYGLHEFKWVLPGKGAQR